MSPNREYRWKNRIFFQKIEIVKLSVIIERKNSLTFLSICEKTEKRIREAEDKSIDIIQLWEQKDNRIGVAEEGGGKRKKGEQGKGKKDYLKTQ